MEPQEVCLSVCEGGGPDIELSMSSNSGTVASCQTGNRAHYKRSALKV